MNLPFLYMINIVMMSRLIFLFGDGRLSWKKWGLMIFIPLLATSAFEPGQTLWWFLGIFCLINLIMIIGDARYKHSEFFRFVVLILFGILFSVFFSPMIHLGFNIQFISQIKLWSSYSSFTSIIQQHGIQKISVVLFGILLVSNEVNLLIRACFRGFSLIPSIKPSKGEKYLLKSIDSKELNAGRLIGILERLIMLLLVMFGSIGSIGFVLAAKAFARFRELDERPFAEYVLIGTLLSTLSAILIGYVLRILL